jgi:hypothetical protein
MDGLLNAWRPIFSLFCGYRSQQKPAINQYTIHDFALWKVLVAELT